MWRRRERLSLKWKSTILFVGVIQQVPHVLIFLKSCVLLRGPLMFQREPF